MVSFVWTAYLSFLRGGAQVNLLRESERERQSERERERQGEKGGEREKCRESRVASSGRGRHS